VASWWPGRGSEGPLFGHFAGSAGFGQLEVQFLQATYLGYGNKKVEPRILDDTLHHSLLVCSSHPAKMLTKQVMALQL